MALAPIFPSVAALPNYEPYLESNTITEFSIFDTATGLVNSYYFDTSDPDSEVVLFDSFCPAEGCGRPPPLGALSRTWTRRTGSTARSSTPRKPASWTGCPRTPSPPEGTTTRAQLVTILHRLEGQPAAGEAAFSDVPAGQWYTGSGGLGRCQQHRQRRV